MINEDDITIYDSSIGFDNGKEFRLEITRTNVDELVSIRKEILDNQKLRERIVDLADLWDGVESSIYGQSLEAILESLGIDDMPKFYGQEMKDMIDEISKERSKERQK